MAPESRIPCKTPGCAATVQHATAIRTGGYCGPCHGRILQSEHEAFIRANRREIDPFNGVTDPVEIAKLMFRSRKYDPLVVERNHPVEPGRFLREMRDDDIQRLIAWSITHSEGETETDKLAVILALKTEHRLDQLHFARLETGDFYPAVVFRSASPQIRDALMLRVEENPNHVLEALAWIGDDRVVRQFGLWRDCPPKFEHALHIQAHEYSRCGGWELDDAGNRRDLHFDRSIALTTGALPSSTTAIIDESTKCPWCGNNLSTLLNIDLTDSRFSWIPFDESNLSFVTCLNCACFDTVFVDLKSKMQFIGAMPSSINSIPDERNLPQRSLHPAAGFRAAHEVAEWMYCDGECSQIGGHPSWVQDIAYPTCPGCKKTMVFVGQVDLSVFPMQEGVYYAYLCFPCHISATNYQQT